jgi:hypothetical protein
MINETLTEYMKKIEINKEVCFYKDLEKGVIYPLTPKHLLASVEYLELDKNEVKKRIFEKKIDNKDYKMYDCEKTVPKSDITKKKEDMFIWTKMTYKGTHIWNVVNQTGIHETFENKEDAIKLCEEINNKVKGL